MTPSAAFTAESVRFKDTNVAQNVIGGVAEIQPASVENDGVVTSYRLFIADDEGKKVGAVDWSVDFNSSAVLTIPDMYLPEGAAKLIARAVSSVGESEFETSVSLVDIVRSPPKGASWSGDIDGDMGIVKGTVTITPAALPINIVGYSIYTAKGMEKLSFLTRVAPGVGTLTADLHYYYTMGEGLLVVSAYSDEEMDFGIFMDVTDFVEADEVDENATTFEMDSDFGWGWGSWGGRRLNEAANPWLKQVQPDLSQIYMLWTVSEASAASHKVLGSLTLPGLATEVTDPMTGDIVFMPPSEGQRKAIVAALAQSLPRVRPEQIRLLKGRVFTGSAARAQASGRGRKLSAEVKTAVQNSPSLVIDFEVVPEDADSTDQQTFLDRVEARLIRVSQGGASAKNLNEVLQNEFVKSGYELPEGGLQTLVAEPKQVQPREGFRRLKEQEGPQVLTDGVTVSTVFADDEGDVQENSGTLAAILAVLGATMAVAGAIIAGTRESWKEGRSNRRAHVEMESISVHVDGRADE